MATHDDTSMRALERAAHAGDEEAARKLELIQARREEHWLREGVEVHGGEPATEDYDEGEVAEVNWEKREALVSWSHGDRSWCPIDLLGEGHPGWWSEANTTVYRYTERGEHLSEERATCTRCGVEGWRGDWPDQGGIVPLDSEMLCDDCAHGTTTEEA